MSGLPRSRPIPIPTRRRSGNHERDETHVEEGSPSELYTRPQLMKLECFYKLAGMVLADALAYNRWQHGAEVVGSSVRAAARPSHTNRRFALPTLEPAVLRDGLFPPSHLVAAWAATASSPSSGSAVPHPWARRRGQERLVLSVVLVMQRPASSKARDAESDEAEAEEEEEEERRAALPETRHTLLEQWTLDYFENAPPGSASATVQMLLYQQLAVFFAQLAPLVRTELPRSRWFAALPGGVSSLVADSSPGSHTSPPSPVPALPSPNSGNVDENRVLESKGTRIYFDSYLDTGTSAVTAPAFDLRTGPVTRRTFQIGPRVRCTVAYCQPALFLPPSAPQPVPVQVSEAASAPPWRLGAAEGSAGGVSVYEDYFAAATSSSAAISSAPASASHASASSAAAHEPARRASSSSSLS